MADQHQQWMMRRYFSAAYFITVSSKLVPFEVLMDIFRQHPDWEWVGQKEEGNGKRITKNGKPDGLHGVGYPYRGYRHYHFYVQLPKPMRGYDFVKYWPRNIWMTPARSKEGSIRYVQKKETRIAGPWGTDKLLDPET
ncbi:hypothetical protein [Bifidobacterium vansinderenii]|nr:hypothetical protein [Bifidobacterium vansinderenii]